MVHIFPEFPSENQEGVTQKGDSLEKEWGDSFEN